jgi:hypothetical protein
MHLGRSGNGCGLGHEGATSQPEISDGAFAARLFGGYVVEIVGRGCCPQRGSGKSLAWFDLPLEPPGTPEFSMRGREICIPAARAHRAKPLSFAAMLRPDEEGAGVLLTELVCQSDWSPTDMLPPTVH